MAVSAFDDKTAPPGTRQLRQALDRNWILWKDLTEWLANEYKPLTEEWVFFTAKSGWSLRLKHRKRTVLYLTPCEGHLRVGFVLGEKAVAALLKGRLPKGIAEEIRTAKKYPEGRAVRLEIKSERDLGHVRRIAEAKMAN
jgi:hypothetical protein